MRSSSIRWMNRWSGLADSPSMSRNVASILLTARAGHVLGFFPKGFSNSALSASNAKSVSQAAPVGHPYKRCPEVNDMRASRALWAYRRAVTLNAP